MKGRLCTQQQIDSKDFARICSEILKHPVIYHRKLWEFVWILQVLEAFGKLQKGKVGLGFGCGEEQLVPALAAVGTKIIATDLDGSSPVAQSWAGGGQHASSMKAWDKFIPNVCSREAFDANVQHAYVDMNHIPGNFLQGEYDFLWSSCSLEHLGSLKHGEEFVLNSLKALKPGGVAVHTTEYNIRSNTTTLETPTTSIYRKRDIESILSSAEAMGYQVSVMNWSPGSQPKDKHVDLPPYLPQKVALHLKLLIDRFVCTSVGFWIRKL